MQDFFSWFENEMTHHIYRIHKLRRIGDWTPYEISNSFIDQSNLEEDECVFVRFINAIELPDKDILLEYMVVSYGVAEDNLYDYVKLSQIIFYRFDNDDKEYYEELHYDIGNEESE